LGNAELIRRKAKLEALLPLVRPEHVDNVRWEIERIKMQLGIPDDRKAPPVDLRKAEAGVDGVGSLRFQATAPPGVGRLVRLPLFPSIVPQSPRYSVVTDAGVGQPASINPVFTVVSDWSTGTPIRMTGLQLRTRVVKFATLRVVGFKASVKFRLQWGYTTDVFPFAPPPAPLTPFYDRVTQQPFVLVKNLTLGGGVNLFPQDEYADAAIYSESVPEFAGLRDYPVLQDPNTCSVNVATTSLSYGIPESLIPGGPLVAPFGAPAAGSPYIFTGVVPTVALVRPVVQVSMNLVCEVLDDALVPGVHVPGPYARPGATSRRPNQLGMEYVR
jgi:hypothetical protein